MIRLPIKKEHGCLYAIYNPDPQLIQNVPVAYMENRQHRDGNRHHITLINSMEMKSLENSDADISNLSENLEVYLFVLGLGQIALGTNHVYYLSVYSEEFNSLRRRFGLKSRDDFHVTIGFSNSDIHDKHKGYQTIISNLNIDLSQTWRIRSFNLLDYIEQKYSLTDQRLLMKRIKDEITQNKSQSYLRTLIDNLKERHSYIGFFLDYIELDKKQSFDLLVTAFDYYTFTENSQYDQNNRFRDALIKEYNTQTFKQDNKFIELLLLLEKEQSTSSSCAPPTQLIVKHRMPRNFSWVIEGKLGGTSALRNHLDILGLIQLNVKRVYYFLEKPEFDHLDPAKYGLEVVYIPTVNTSVPKLDDMNQVIEETFSSSEPVFYGCLGGYGRTGTALACYLTRYPEAMSSESAISYLRSIRPKSIESTEQFSFVKKFSSCNFDADKRALTHITRPKCKLIILVGLPGAGKSTFCDLIMSSGYDINVINQDSLGRKQAESELSRSVKKHDITILDRTNITRKDRQEWLSLASLDPTDVICVYIATSAQVSLIQAGKRQNHPTLKPGRGAEKIIMDLAKKLEEPVCQEGYSKVVVLEDAEDMANYLKLWNCRRIRIDNSNDPDKIHKFPRTTHLINYGTASRDDLLVSKEDYGRFLSKDAIVEVTEKVDGCQLGFSITENYQIRVQNRSHYVDSKYHSQFKILDKWVHQHQEDLFKVLTPDLILFGEWLYARHSLSYDKLPDYFLAFDLYSKKESRFYSREYLEKVLDETNICLTKLIHRGPISEPFIKRILDGDSEYREGHPEGVYLKMCQDGYTISRSKVVRSGFICGNSHWSKREVEVNSIIRK